MKKTLLLLLLAILPTFIFALSGKEHEKDMQRIFPFVKCKNNNKITTFYSLVNQYIDQPNDINIGKPVTIANHPKFKNMKFGNHRIWYHWGFNTNPKKHLPLIAAIHKNIEKEIISETDVDEFWDCLMKDVGKRNRYLMNSAAEIFGYGAIGSISRNQREQLNAFVTILYSIHIIGDHQTSETSVMSDLKMIYGDVYNAINNLAGRDNRSNANRLKKALILEQSNPKRFLDKMEKEFSPFLMSLDSPLYNYKKKFSDIGYQLR
ncbi:MAG: hypothetical protein ACOH2V_12160 [Candidatus Saccharimonadaceae bacterium]